MSDSPLVCYRDISEHCTRPRNHRIDSVAIHCMAGNLSIESCGNVFHQREASSNYGIGSDGRIGQYVYEADRAWTTSNEGVDNRSITIEVANNTNGEPWGVTDAAYEALINLLVDICRRNSISSLRWMANREYARAAAAGGPVSSQNMFVHRWFSTKSCPGNFLYSAHSAIASEVNRRLQGNTPIVGIPAGIVVVNDGGGTASSSTSDSTSGTNYISTGVSVDYKELTPFIITLDRKSPSVNLKKMKSVGVRGVLIEAGYLFDSLHNKVVFRNPRCYDQVESAIEQDLDFAFYMIGRARSKSDAVDEMYQLSFIVRKYSPALGLWIVPDFTRNKNMNDIIVNKYQDELVRLGLKSKIGFYCTERDLAKFSWDKLQNDWYLWIQDHVSNISEIDQLLTPEFFDMDGKG